MSFTQTALILLVVFWSLQAAAAWVQWRHCRRALATATRADDGFLGMGQYRPKLGRGAIALLETTADGHVRRLQTMSGWSVFARFEADATVAGWPLARLASDVAPDRRDDRRARAIRQAIEQVETVRAKASAARNEPGLAPIPFPAPTH